MNLESIFGNKVVKKMLFGKLSAFAVEYNIRTIVITLDDKGEITGEPSFYSEETVTITKTEFTNLIKNQK